MARIILSNIGSFPRVGDEKDHQRYRRGYAHFERQEISAHAFRDVVQSVIQEIIRDQESCLLDEVTDGLVSWMDPISHFCTNVSGIESTGLTRYYNTNFYFRKPVIISTPKFKGPMAADEYRFAQSVSAKSVRPILTGPFTLSAHIGSTAKKYSKSAMKTEFFMDLLSQEVAALVNAGAPLIQIDEPEIAKGNVDIKAAYKFFKKIQDLKKSTRIALALSFFPLGKIWSKVQNLPVDVFQLDFTHDQDELFKKVTASRETREMGLGILDALNTKMEPVSRLAESIGRWMDATNPTFVTLAPSAGLEFLPRTSALAKLKLLSTIKNQLLQRSLERNP